MKKFTENLNTKSIFDDVGILKSMLSNIGVSYKIKYLMFTERDGDLYNLIPAKDNNFWINKEFMNDYSGTKGKVFAYQIIFHTDLPILTKDAQRVGALYYQLSDDFFELMEKIEHLKYEMETDGYTLSISFNGTGNINPSTLPIQILIFNGKFK